MKLKHILIIVVLSILFGIMYITTSASAQSFGDGNINVLDQWVSSSSPVSNITQRTFGKKIKVTGLTTGLCLSLDSNSLVTTSACSGSGISLPVSYANGGSATTTARGLGNLLYVSPLGGNNQDDTQGFTPAYEGQISASYPGTKAPFLYAGGSTVKGDWYHSINFGNTIGTVGDPVNNDPLANGTVWNLNGGAGSYNATGDTNFGVRNMSANVSNSGTGLCTWPNTITATGSSTDAGLGHAAGACLQHVPTNRQGGLSPGMEMIILNKSATDMRGFGVGSPGLGSLTGANQMIQYNNLINPAFEVPHYQSCVLYPFQTCYSFTVSGITTAPAFGDVYTTSYRGVEYTVMDISGLSGSPKSGTILMVGTSTPPASGTLVASTTPGNSFTTTSGDTSITFSGQTVAQTYADSFKVNPVSGLTTILNASTTGAFSSPVICLGSVCNSIWPAGGSGVVSSGLAKQVPFYAADGTTLTATSSIAIETGAAGGGVWLGSKGDGSHGPRGTVEIFANNGAARLDIAKAFSDSNNGLYAAGKTQDEYLHIGGQEYGTGNGYQCIGFAYNAYSASEYSPASICSHQTSSGGSTLDDLTFFTRNGTGAATPPTNVLTLTSDGKVQPALIAFAVGDSAVCQHSDGSLSVDTGVSSCIVSSKKVKHDIKPVDILSAKERIAKLQAVTFAYNGSNKEDIGLIAEDVAKIDPRYAQYNAKGEPSAINWSAITTDMLTVIQSQQTNGSSTTNVFLWISIIILASSLVIAAGIIKMKK